MGQFPFADNMMLFKMADTISKKISLLFENTN